MSDEMKLDISWTNFIKYLKEHHLHDSTIEKYMYQARKFAATDALNETDRKIFFIKINEFASQGNRRFCLFAIKHLLRFLNRGREWNMYYKRMGVELKQRPRLIQNKFLRREEILSIREQLPEPFRTILMVQYEGAMRISEVLLLEKKDIKKDDQGHIQLSITMKGGEKMTVTLMNPDTVLAFRNIYNSITGLKLFDYTLETVNKYYKEAARKVMINGNLVSSHWLRHSRAVDVWNKTRDVMVIKLMLRHKRLETTYEYLRSCGLLEKEVMEHNPVNWEDKVEIISPVLKEVYDMQGEPAIAIVRAVETKPPETQEIPIKQPEEVKKKTKDIFD